jgi:hypothetical protein
MSLFTIDISGLLISPVGTMDEFHFEQELESDTFETFLCTEPLIMDIRIIRRDYGVECLFQSIQTTIDIPEEYLQGQEILLEHISREFHLKERREDTDDVEYIDPDETIDLGRVIAQELLIAGL